MTDEVRLARAWLSRVVEPGSVLLHRMLELAGPVETVAAIRAGAAPNDMGGLPGAGAGDELAEADLAAAEVLGIRLVTPEDDEWPAYAVQPMAVAAARDARDSAPPQALWVRGAARLDEVAARSVAVVGSRSATPYGEHVAGDLAYRLVERGWTVVSGGAYGIDGAAHRGALAAGGPTIAVIGGGLRDPYPAGHAALFEAIARDGLLVSEWPPDSAPRRTRFLVRNRLIAGMTAGTVVVEAALRSGALNSASAARRYGRMVLAVPGPVTSRVSDGCHDLVQKGLAQLVTRAEDVLEAVGEIGADLAPPRAAERRPRDALDPVAQQVLDGLPARGVVSPDAIAVGSGVPPLDVLRALPALELSGFVESVTGGWRLTPAARR